MRTRYLIPKVTYLSAFYSRRIRKKPFREWAASIGASMQESTRAVAPDRYMHQVALAVDWVCNRVPWQSMCLVRALTAKKMLNDKGYPCTLYMGVKKDENGAMLAHAWLRCGESYITGGNGNGYTVTGKFADTWEK